MANIKGVDISSWQGDIDYDKLKKVVDFVIMKCTEGGSFVDNKFVRNQIEARRVGLGVGYYHFARPDLGNTPEVEANFFLDTIKEIRNGEVLFLDFEVSYNDVVDWCTKFLNQLSNKLGGYKPLIYLNQSQVKNYDWSPIIEADYGLWLAAYVTTLPKTPWETVAFQQTSSSGTTSGISGKIDTNIFFGDIETFYKYGYQTTTPNTQETTNLKNTIIDWFDFEGNSHKVGWYVDGWQNEKENCIKCAEGEAKWRKMYEDSQKDASGVRQDLITKDKTINTLTKDKELLSVQITRAVEELEGLRSENTELSKKATIQLGNIEELSKTLDKLQSKIIILENSKEITFLDVVKYVKQLIIKKDKII